MPSLRSYTAGSRGFEAILTGTVKVLQGLAGRAWRRFLAIFPFFPEQEGPVLVYTDVGNDGSGELGRRGQMVEGGWGREWRGRCRRRSPVGVMRLPARLGAGGLQYISKRNELFAAWARSSVNSARELLRWGIRRGTSGWEGFRGAGAGRRRYRSRRRCRSRGCRHHPFSASVWIRPWRRRSCRSR